jgi:Flp pilus assembly protein TadG
VSRGQALVELSVCVPIVLLFAVGGAACVQVADARSGLEAATQAAAAAAARAPDASSAKASALQRFQAIVASYPLGSPAVAIDLGGFQRSGQITITSSASVDVGWAGLLHLPADIVLRASAAVNLESWRTHR